MTFSTIFREHRIVTKVFILEKRISDILSEVAYREKNVPLSYNYFFECSLVPIYVLEMPIYGDALVIVREKERQPFILAPFM